MKDLVCKTANRMWLRADAKSGLNPR
jgi:hypothetical protein